MFEVKGMNIMIKISLKVVSIIVLVCFLSLAVYNSPSFWAVNTYSDQVQVDNNQLLTTEEMEEDLDYLIDRMENVHPKTRNGLNDKQKEKIQSIKMDIQKPLLAKEFYFQVNALINTLEDAHSTMFFIETEDCFRAHFIWISDGLYINEDLDMAKKGDQVIKIGDLTVNQILEKMRCIVPAENDYWIKKRSESYLQKKSILEYLGVVDDSEVKLILRRGDDIIQTSVGFLNIFDEISTKQKMFWNVDEVNNYGYFRFDTCTNNEVYKEAVNSFFNEVKNNSIENVVVDLRHNMGGDSTVINTFLNQIAVEEIKAFSSGIRYSKEAKAEIGYFPISGFKNFDDYYETLNDKDMLNDRYNGHLYVLTSNVTFSSANWFAVIVRDNDLGSIVGEPTGNAPNSYGDVLEFKLPHSGFAFQLSHKIFYRPNHEIEESMLDPDILIELSIEDVLEDRDVVLEELIEIMNN